jgi:hypothetical protein
VKEEEEKYSREVKDTFPATQSKSSVTTANIPAAIALDLAVPCSPPI